MAWKDLIATDEYKSLSKDDRLDLRDKYFQQKVFPKAQEYDDPDKVKQMWYDRTVELDPDLKEKGLLTSISETLTPFTKAVEQTSKFTPGLGFGAGQTIRSFLTSEGPSDKEKWEQATAIKEPEKRMQAISQLEGLQESAIGAEDILTIPFAVGKGLVKVGAKTIGKQFIRPLAKEALEEVPEIIEKKALKELPTDILSKTKIADVKTSKQINEILEKTGLAKLKKEQSTAGIIKLGKEEPIYKEAKFPEQVEQAFKASKGIKPESRFDKLKNVVSDLKNKATRTYEHLPNEPYYSEVTNDLVKLGKQSSVSHDKTIRNIGEVLSDLDKKDYDLFTRKVFADDLVNDVSRGIYKDKKIPFFDTEDVLNSAKTKTDELVESNPAVKKALEKRKSVWDGVKKEYIDAMKPYDPDVEDLFKDDYFRHQVLDYVQNKYGSGKKLKAPLGRGFRKGRTGYSGLYNTDFLEAENQVMGQMIHDTQIAKTIKKISDDYSITKKLKDAHGKAWRDFIPEGYTEVQPTQGSIFYKTFSLPEKQAIQLIEGNVDPAIADKLKSVIALGGKRSGIVVKDEIANTLNELYKDTGKGAFDKLNERTINTWKKWVTSAPTRIIKFSTRNLLGDAEATAIGNPKALRKVPKSIKELWDVLVKKKPMTEEMRQYFERGGFDSTLIEQEIKDIKNSWMFKRLYGSKDFNLLKKYWQAAKFSNNFREQILRYANFLDYADYFKKTGKLRNYGASPKGMIDALKNPYDKFFNLSNDLIGAYDKTSVAGQWLRKKAYPFWSFREANAKRYVNLFKNAANDNKLASQIGKSLGAKTAFRALKLGKFAVKALGFTAMLHAYNNTMFPEEEKELSEEIRNTPHIILGRDKNGKIDYFNRVGLLDDFISWAGVDNIPGAYQQFLNGKPLMQILKDQAKETALAPTKQLIQGSFPILKTGFEAATQRSLFPDPFRPRTIRDRKMHIARSLGVDAIYRELGGLPSRGKKEALKSLYKYSIDPGEAAYRDVMDRKMEFLRDKGQESTSMFLSPTSNAFYNMKMAARFGDREAFDKYFNQVLTLGGVTGLKSLPQRINSLIMQSYPLQGLSGQNLAEFLKVIKKENPAKYERALKFWKENVHKTGELLKESDVLRNFAKQQESKNE